MYVPKGLQFLKTTGFPRTTNLGNTAKFKGFARTSGTDLGRFQSRAFSSLVTSSKSTHDPWQPSLQSPLIKHARLMSTLALAKPPGSLAQPSRVFPSSTALRQVPVRSFTTASGTSAKPAPWWEKPGIEAGWKADFGEEGGKQKPAPHKVLHRSDDQHPSEKFSVGEPPEGSNFNVSDHVHRTGSDRGDDALRGNTIAASWPSDGGGRDGPLHHTGRYLHVIHDAYAVGVGRQEKHGVTVSEQELATHAVPPHKFVASLDKHTGEIHINPNQSPEQAAYHRDRLSRLHGVYKRFAPE